MPWGKKEKKEKKAKERARSPAKEKPRPRSPANHDLSRVWSPAHDDGKSPTAPAATWSSGPGLQPELSTVGQPVPEPPAPQLHPATGPAPLHELTQVQWLADGYVMNAADAPDAAKDEYRRLIYAQVVGQAPGAARLDYPGWFLLVLGITLVVTANATFTSVVARFIEGRLAIFLEEPR